MSKIALGGLGGEAGKWLTLVVALGGVGLLPKGWQKAAGVAAVLLALKGLSD